MLLKTLRFVLTIDYIKNPVHKPQFSSIRWDSIWVNVYKVMLQICQCQGCRLNIKNSIVIKCFEITHILRLKYFILCCVLITAYTEIKYFKSQELWCCCPCRGNQPQLNSNLLLKMYKRIYTVAKKMNNSVRFFNNSLTDMFNCLNMLNCLNQLGFY